MGVADAVDEVSEYIRALPIENPETWEETLHRVIFSNAFDYGVNNTPQKLINSMRSYQLNADEFREALIKRFGTGKIVDAKKYHSKMAERYRGSGPSYVVRILANDAVETYRIMSWGDFGSIEARLDTFVHIAIDFSRLGCTPEDFVIIMRDVEKILCRVIYYAVKHDRASMDGLLAEILMYDGLFGVPGAYDSPDVEEGRERHFRGSPPAKPMPENYLNIRPHIWEPWAKYLRHVSF